MSALRHPAAQGRRDANHREIDAAYRQCGASVVDTHILGGDVPDMVVGLLGVDAWVEIKMEDGDLSVGQIDFARKWRGRTVRVIRSIADVVEHCNELRREACRRAYA
jgi:hypothetical protein